MRECLCLLIVLTVLALATAAQIEPLLHGEPVTSQTESTPNLEPALKPTRLLQAGSLTYVGAFRVPTSPWKEAKLGRHFGYGGTAPAVGHGGLYLVGHDHKQLTAQITIPEPKIAPVAELPRATFLQPFTDATGGKRWQVEGTSKIGGHLVYGDKLLTTVYEYYDADGSTKVSHCVSSLDLTGANGLFRLAAPQAGYVAGYMTSVPKTWRDRLGVSVLTGQNGGIPIIGRTSAGPAAFGFDPEQLGAVDPVPTVPCLYYSIVSTSTPDRSLPGWLTTDWANGCAFIGDTVLFVGTRGTGPYWYGEPGAGPNGTTDPCRTGKGPHAPPYRTTVWLYDAHDFAAVVRGDMKPWHLRPYERFELPIGGDCASIGGCAYDAATGRLYVSQLGGERLGYDPFPVIHVYEIGD